MPERRPMVERTSMETITANKKYSSDKEGETGSVTYQMVRIHGKAMFAACRANTASRQ